MKELDRAVKDAYAEQLNPLIDAFKTTVNTQNSMMESVKGLHAALTDHAETLKAMHEEMNKPKKRTLVRGKDGRAMHSIEESIK